MALAALTDPTDDVEGGEGVDLNVTLKSGVSMNSNLNTSGQFSAPRSLLNTSMASNVTFGGITSNTNTSLSASGTSSLNDDVSRSSKARAMVDRIRALRANANAANAVSSSSNSRNVVANSDTLISSNISNASTLREDLHTAQAKTLPPISDSSSSKSSSSGAKTIDVKSEGKE